MVEAALEHGTVTAVNRNAANSRLVKLADADRLHIVPESNPFLVLDSLRTDCAGGIRLWAGGVGLLQTILWASLKKPLPVVVVIGSYQPVSIGLSVYITTRDATPPDRPLSASDPLIREFIRAVVGKGTSRSDAAE
jgi:hypothetical protein